jgi:glycosyltransferase involved in cell wall biosynthesis
MKLLFVNETFYPDVASTAQHLADLSFSFAEGADRGELEVDVLCGRRSYVDPEILHLANETHRGVNIRRVWSPNIKRRGKIARILDAFLCNIAFAFRLLFSKRYDVVVSLTSPPLVAFFAVLYSRLRGSRFVYWVMDVNPHEAIAANWMRSDSVFATLLRASLRFVLARSDVVIALDVHMKELLISEGAIESRVVVSPPWPIGADEISDRGIERRDNSFRKEYSLGDRFVVMYSGNHSICHPLDTILEAANRLRNDESVVFVFVGGGQRVRDVSEFVAKHQLSNVVQLPYQPRERLAESLGAADMHLVVMGEPFVGIVHPCKIYGILASGASYSYVGPASSHLGEIVELSKGAFQVEHGDSAMLLSAIAATQRLSETEREAIARGNRLLLKNKFSEEELLATVKRSISDVV